MPPPYCYDYPRPAVTVDLAVFRLDPEGLRILMIRRKQDPFAGSWAFPGGFVEIEEMFEDAARRELLEETGFAATGPLGFVGVYGDPGRDPRGRTISMVYATAVARSWKKVAGGDDAAAAEWLDPWTLRDLAFDHDTILGDSLDWLQDALLAGDLTASMLPREFDQSIVRKLFEFMRIGQNSVKPWLSREVKAARVVESEGIYKIAPKTGRGRRSS